MLHLQASSAETRPCATSCRTLPAGSPRSPGRIIASIAATRCRRSIWRPIWSISAATCNRRPATAGSMSMSPARSRSPPTARSRSRWWSPSWSPMPPSTPIRTAWPDRSRSASARRRWPGAVVGGGRRRGPAGRFRRRRQPRPRHADHQGAGQPARRRDRGARREPAAPSSCCSCRQPCRPCRLSLSAEEGRCPICATPAAGRAHAGDAGRHQSLG